MRYKYGLFIAVYEFYTAMIRHEPLLCWTWKHFYTGRLTATKISNLGKCAEIKKKNPFLNLNWNKKVLLRYRKRRTTCGVSCPGEGVPWPGTRPWYLPLPFWPWRGGYPRPKTWLPPPQEGTLPPLERTCDQSQGRDLEPETWVPPPPPSRWTDRQTENITFPSYFVRGWYRIEDNLETIKGQGLVWDAFVNWQARQWRKGLIQRRIAHLVRIFGSPVKYK